MKLDLSSRTTTEIVVIFLTVMICLVVATTILATLIYKFVHPEMDVSKASDSINNMISMVLGGIVGFINGRAVGKREKNGSEN